MNHYRCFRIFLPHTGREIIADTVRFLPKKIPFPHETGQDRLVRAVEKIEQILNNVAPSNSPNVPNCESIKKSFAHISKLLKNEQTSPPIKKPKLAPTRNTAPEPRVQERIVVPTLPSMPKFLTANHLSSNASKKYNFQAFLHHIYDDDGKKLNIDKLITDPTTAPTWSKSLENELGRLSQGFKNRVTPQDALDFIRFSDVPQERKVTYANFVCDYRPLKAEKIRCENDNWRRQTRLS